MRHFPQRSFLALGIAAIGVPASAAGPVIQAESIEVIGNTPLAGIGVARLQMPANVQTVSGQQLEEQESLNLPEFMARQLPSVNLNEIQGNPYQPAKLHVAIVATV